MSMQEDVRQLLAVIGEAAEAEKAGVRARAEQKIAEIGARIEAQIKQLRDEALARVEDQLRSESECIIGRAELEMRDTLIHEKNEALREVFELARKQIAVMNDFKTSKEVLRRLIREAISKINGEAVRLRISKKDLPLWKSLKGDFPPSISVELCDEPKGTVIVETNDRSQSIDNSIATRLETAREVLRWELADLLFDAEISGEEGK
jgi:vacuolar-type H+-ATPase subunit E/Vma4